jgi:cell division protein FtsW (lipid II flippase)
MSLRNRELASLVVVGTLVGFGFASVYIARQEVINSASLSYGLFFLGLYIAAHVIARITVPSADPYLLPMAGLLTGIGLTEIYRLDENDAFKQGLWIVIGLGAFAATLFLLHADFRRLESYKYLFGLSAIALLVLPAVPGLGKTVNGARLWVHVGPVHFQPGELAKILLIVFLAGYLREKREVLAQFRLKDLGPLFLIWGCAMLVLVVTNDLGGGLLYFGIFLAMLYVATAQVWFVVSGAALFVGGAAALYTVIPRVEERVQIWLDPWKDPFGQGYQAIQSLYSIANGGFGGTGLARARTPIRTETG